jgi:hypothetical protein
LNRTKFPSSLTKRINYENKLKKKGTKAMYHGGKKKGGKKKGGKKK